MSKGFLVSEAKNSDGSSVPFATFALAIRINNGIGRLLNQQFFDPVSSTPTPLFSVLLALIVGWQCQRKLAPPALAVSWISSIRALPRHCAIPTVLAEGLSSAFLSPPPQALGAW